MAVYTGELKIVSKDPRINYNLLPGEELMTCPYNLSHAILPIKFAKHVNNCHRLHLKAQADKGKKSEFSICQHDRSHHVRHAELAFHEKECPSNLANDPTGGWGWGDDDAAGGGAGGGGKVEGAAGGASGATKDEPWVWEETKPITVEIPKETLDMMTAESWDDLPPAPTFNPDARIHQLRMSGYDYIKTADVIGLTKSEKKQFYEDQSNAMQTYQRQGMFQRLREGGEKSDAANFAKTRSTLGTMSSTHSMYGEDSNSEF